MKITTLALACLATWGLSNTAAAQKNFKVTNRGLLYNMVKDAPGKTPNIGDVLEAEITMKVGDSLLMDTRAKGQNARFDLAEPAFNGDLMEGFAMMSPGDVAVFKMPVDSVPKDPNQPLPEFVVKAGTMDYTVTLISVKTMEEVKAEQEKLMADQKKATEAQVAIDEDILKTFLKLKNIKATRTASGLYYAVDKMGTGKKAASGNEVTMNYTGKLLNDSVFDSNVLPRFNHVSPFKFKIGTGQVIAGWDEGIAMLPKGTKGTLYIPSGLAYGLQGRPPMIPANSVLVFDVEVVDIAEPAKPASAEDNDKAIQAYIKSHKVKNVQKTASGLYYSITKLGSGPKPKVGQTVSMNYTGKLVTDTVFDSNVLPKFGHVQPFEFNLGQGMVIRGWDEGVALLSEGTKATLYIPSSLGYGDAGSPPVIPANAPLIFDVELVEIK